MAKRYDILKIFVVISIRVNEIICITLSLHEKTRKKKNPMTNVIYNTFRNLYLYQAISFQK